MATKEPSQNTLHFAFECVYFKNEFGDPHLFLLGREKQAKIKLYAKLKKFSGADHLPNWKI